MRLQNGNVAIAWAGPVTGGVFGLLPAVYAEPIEERAETRVSATAMTALPRVAVTPLVSGSLAIAWQQPEGAATTPTDVFLRVNNDPCGIQADPALAILAANNFVATLTGVDSADAAMREGIEAQAFKATGAAALTRDSPAPIRNFVCGRRVSFHACMASRESQSVDHANTLMCSGLRVPPPGLPP